MGCRKNQASLTAGERTAFVSAVLGLKTKPSQMGLTNRYDDYVKTHMDSMSGIQAWAHRRPAFLPWHREFLRRFELDLQAIDPSVDLPYWDWTVDNQPNSTIWNADFMGGNGQAGDHKVTTGPFAHANGNWNLNVHDPDDSGQAFLTRDFGTDSFAPTLPSASHLSACMNETPYDESPWNDSGTLTSFRNRLEGWYGLGSIHNRVHVWVGGGDNPGGDMLYMTSPNDPVFWLHHCNIDRLWSIWQDQHPTEGYHPTGVGPDTGPAGHNLPDSMQPWGGTTTVASQQNHQAMGYWYDTDPAEVTLTTPSLSFTDVPEGIGGGGITTYRAVVFEVRSCPDVTLSILSGPTGGFATTALGTSATVNGPGPGPGIARLWIAYTSTNAGDVATGSVVVGQNGTANQWVISLTANTIARPKSAVALALDRSGSMGEIAGGGVTKHQLLLDAVEIFVDTMQDGDGLSMVSFDDQIDRLFDITDVGPQPATPGSGRALAATVLASTDLDPRGMTAIGGAVLEGQDALADAQAIASPPYDEQALVVLTDGIETAAPYLSSVTGSITARTFGVGLGLPGSISAAALDLLTGSTGGALLITGAIGTTEQFRLSKYFLQVLAGITNADIVVDPVGELVLGPTHRIPFTLNEADYGVDAILTSPLAPVIDFRLEAPDGTIIDPGVVALQPSAAYVGRRLVSYYRLPLPSFGGMGGVVHAGKWTALLTLDKRLGSGGGRMAEVLATHAISIPRRSVPYNFLVHGYSSLRMTATADRTVVAPGDPVGIVATLAEYGVPVDHRAAVWAEITAPNGFVTSVPLAETDPGTFHGTYSPTVVGLHVARVRAAGTTLYGTPFTREETLSVAAMRGGDVGVDPIRELIDHLDARDERLCDLLECLLGDRRLLERLGLDPDLVLKCLKVYCRPRTKRAATEGRREGGAMPERPARPEHAEMVRPSAIREALRRAAASARGVEGVAGADEPEGPIARLVEPPPPAPEPPMEHPMTGGRMFGLSPQDIEEGEKRLAAEAAAKRRRSPAKSSDKPSTRRRRKGES